MTPTCRREETIQPVSQLAIEQLLPFDIQHSLIVCLKDVTRHWATNYPITPNSSTERHTPPAPTSTNCTATVTIDINSRIHYNTMRATADLGCDSFPPVNIRSPN
uniref:Uncharacterized protein n=1 Tax=Echinococcus granulosus TaxID=6210 RepID=U6FVN3_ECHGR|nr:hypothetical protein EgrG_002069100 [Echinococcus granulosus]